MRTPTGEPAIEQLSWQALKQGDAIAFSQLYTNYVRLLYNYGYRFVADAELVEDAIQELFIDLWRLRETLSDTTSVRFYLFRSLRRKIHEAVVRKEKSADFLTGYSYGTELGPSTEDELMQQEQHFLRLNCLRQLLSRLSGRQQEAIRLRFYDEFSWAEIAEIMIIDEQSVRNLVQRGLIKLRRAGQTLLVLLLLGYALIR